MIMTSQVPRRTRIRCSLPELFSPGKRSSFLVSNLFSGLFLWILVSETLLDHRYNGLCVQSYSWVTIYANAREACGSRERKTSPRKMVPLPCDHCWGRRKAFLLVTTSFLSTTTDLPWYNDSTFTALAISPPSVETKPIPAPQFCEVRDPSTFSALSYAPPRQCNKNDQPLPLIVFLHGAGQRRGSLSTVWELADPQGQFAGLLPSRIADSSSSVPDELLENFAVVAPYAEDSRNLSFYEEPRSKILRFIDWYCSEEGRKSGCAKVDPARICLFGFSDGATVAVELATTLRFRACVIASYGFTGNLPSQAKDRLVQVPMWVFHSADDAIFPVSSSDRLVQSLQEEADRLQTKSLVRYTRFEVDPEEFQGAVRGHTTGITASKNADVYKWLLSYC